MRNNRRTTVSIKTIFVFLAASFFIIGFQNCSGTGFQSIVSNNNAAGTSGTQSGGSGNAPANVYLILQGETAAGVAQMDGSSTNLSPNYDEIGWTCVTGASAYNIYRATNGGAYSLYASTTAADATSTYSNYVSGQGSHPVMPLVNCAYFDTTATNVVTATKYGTLNVTGSTAAGSNVLTISSVKTGKVTAGQGIGGPGIPQGTTINAFGSGGTTGNGGPGTYQLSQAATSTNSAATYGTLFFPNNGYTYYVTAIVNGAESPVSADAKIPYIVNGEALLNQGVFNGNVTWNAAAPAATPLGFNNALYWQGDPANSIMNPFSGNSAASQNLGVAGYNYCVLSFYTVTPGVSLTMGPEISGDQGLYNSGINLSDFGPQYLTPNAWTTYKIPLSQMYEDEADGTNVLQTAFYKFTLQYNYDIGNANFYVEIYFSVN